VARPFALPSGHQPIAWHVEDGRELIICPEAGRRSVHRLIPLKKDENAWSSGPHECATPVCTVANNSTRYRDDFDYFPARQQLASRARRELWRRWPELAGRLRPLGRFGEDDAWEHGSDIVRIPTVRRRAGITGRFFA
jgi:hypothetical protein